ncbi:hypothetical protein RIF29_30260 [Crotalaria pallida]|uniref:C2H2-type domain-containing protein n=1 Tax=Crotalaria pallida TaxID=3830 RepID=A0AAN9I155_CROPI
MQFNTQNSNDNLGLVKTYSCSFCKRGFSNAQALGGHMNTHRRDRAKLRQLSYEENLLSLDMSIKNTNDHETFPLEDKSASHHKNNDHVTQKGKVICTEELPHHLPSFAVVQGFDEEKKGDLDLELKLGFDQEAPTLRSIREIEKKPLFTFPAEFSHQADLDLELRLGTEPLEAPTLSTIEFF